MANTAESRSRTTRERRLTAGEKVLRGSGIPGGRAAGSSRQWAYTSCRTVLKPTTLMDPGGSELPPQRFLGAALVGQRLGECLQEILLALEGAAAKICFVVSIIKSPLSTSDKEM